MDLGDLWIAFLGGLILVEFRAWRPWACKALINLASTFTPETHKERLREEWSAHVEDVPGDLGKLLVALGFVIAGAKLNAQVAARRAFFTMRFITFGPTFYVMVVERAQEKLDADKTYAAAPDKAKRYARREMRTLALKSTLQLYSILLRQTEGRPLLPSPSKNKIDSPDSNSPPKA